MEHPEIDSTLLDVGMVKDIQAEENRVSPKPLLPIIGIPPVIRDDMINSLKHVVYYQGAELDVTLAETTPHERQSFFKMEHQNWRG